MGLKYSVLRKPVNYLLVLLLVILQVVIAAPAEAAFSWQIVGSGSVSTDIASYISLGVADNGTEYVAYSAVNDEYKATVRKHVAGEWLSVGPDKLDFKHASFINLRVHNNTPYLSFTSTPGSPQPSYAYVLKFDSSSNTWKTLGGGSVTNGVAWYNSLYITDDGTIYVAFLDKFEPQGGYGGILKVFVYNETHDTWTRIHHAEDSELRLNHSFLTLAVHNQTPYVSYRDTSTEKAAVVKYDASTMRRTTLDDFASSTPVANSVSLSLGQDGTPYVAFGKDGQYEKGATVMKYTTAEGWQRVGDSVSSYTSQQHKLVVYNNIPYLVFHDSNFKCVKFTGDSWLPFAETPAGALDFVMHGGVPYVTYAAPADTSAIVLKGVEDTFTVTVQSADGTVTGAGNYAPGAKVTLQATPKDSFDFVNWTDAENKVSTQNPYTFTMPAANVAITANYQQRTPVTYQVTVTSANGTVTGAGSYEAGAQVTLQATPKDGFDFVNWTDAENKVSTQNPYTFTMPAADVTITANYQQQTTTPGTYKVTVTANNGAVTGAGSYKKGDPVTLQAAANTGYQFVNWTTSSGKVLTTQNPYIFNMPEGNVVLAANFAQLQATKHAVQVSATNGTVKGSGDYAAGVTVRLEAVAASGYELVSWTTTDGVVVSRANPYVFVMGNEAISLQANFQETEVPELPKTSGHAQVYYEIGLLLAAVGIYLKRKR
ncbi:MAG TPA: InlB B-repeat-containing protein [Oscillospiraceae bacterium]|nr:InlB B-repeat-containing protein [Oscillospiraceae bacterium]